MRINHNIAALDTNRWLSINETSTQKSLQKLSSGLRINSAADDAAGLAISEKMRGQIRGLDQASSNAQDGISLIQTAEGALNETESILQRMRELATQSANDTATEADRGQIQKEMDQLKSEVDRISSTTEFNTKKLLNGSLSTAKTAQGTITNSALFKAADTAATAGNNQAGLAVAISQAASGKQGTGASITMGNALADTIIIQSGVNDKFGMTINGVTQTTLSGITIGAGTYTRDQFVSALNTAVQSGVGATDWANKNNQVIFSLTTDNHLKVTTVATGNVTSVTITAPGATSGASESALTAMGHDGQVAAITGTVDLTSGIALSGGSGTTFKVQVGGAGAWSGVVVDLVTDAGIAASGFVSLSGLISGLQQAFDSKLGSGTLTVGNDASGHLTITSNIATNTLNIYEGSGAIATNFGIVQSGVSGANPTNTTVNGTNTVNAVAAGTVISSGSNDQFNISVDGGTAQTITLTAGTYNASGLVTAINNGINDNSNLVGKVTAQLGSDGKIKFVSNSTGSSSSVTLSNPSSSNQSALGALGYAGTAGILSGSVNIHSGLNLTSGNSVKFSATLGQKTATIDITHDTGIFATSGTSGTVSISSRDAIVTALQTEFDKSFGSGAVTVNTVSDPSTGSEYLTFTPNDRAAQFNITNGTGNSGVTDLYGAASGTALVSATGTNVQTTGTNAVQNTLSASTLLTQIADTDGNNLGLTAGNVINITGTQNGNGFSASVTVSGVSTIADVLNSMRNLSQFQGATVSLNTTTGKIVVTGVDGQTRDIANLKFAAQKSAADSTAIAGFNSKFDTFNVTQQAQDAHSDTSLSMMIGANQGQTMSVDINDMGTNSLKIQDIDVTTQSGAQTAISVINNAIDTVSTERSKLGAFQNRLEHTINNLGTSSENLSTAESRIRDVDMAKEMTNFTKNNILSQAAQAMLVQANQQPQQVLSLLR